MTAMTNCAHCSTAMPTPTGRQARRRYCSEPCRKAAWRDRHRDNDDVLARNTVADIVPDTVVVPTAFRDDVATPGGQHCCPHCRQPLAIISVVIPAGAAHITVPEVPHDARLTATLSPPPEEDDLATPGNFGERQQSESRRGRKYRRNAVGRHYLPTRSGLSH